MSDNRLPSAAQLPHQAREAVRGFKDRYRQWREDLKEDPSLLWRTPAIRITFYLVLAVGLILAVRWGTNTLAGAGAANKEDVKKSTLYVSCTDPNCLKSFNATVAMDFKTWPLKCDQCGQLTVYRATLCKVCRNWYAVAPTGPDGCPFCRKRFDAAKPTTKPKAKPANSDDAEDGWN